MKKIEHQSEIKRDEFLSLIDQITQEFQKEIKATEVEVVDAIIDILAFKYWQENLSVEVNASLESSDYSYVQQHWNLFCKSSIGKVLGYSESYSRGKMLCQNQSERIAIYVGRLSRYVTHRNFDFSNAQVIENWLMSHWNAVINGGLDKKARALIKVYRRGKEDSNANLAGHEDKVS